MREAQRILVTFATPWLVVISLCGFFIRKGNDRVQVIPAFMTGVGLITSNSILRNRYRKQLLEEIRDIRQKI